MEVFYFRRLDVYQNSMKLTKKIYSYLNKYPTDERFALCSQMRRAVTSIPINIAEGFGRISYKDKARFIEIAYGSLMEIVCELEISLEENYITENDFSDSEKLITTIAKQLSKLRTSVINNGNLPFHNP